jgi:hypothetical protein
VAVVIPHEVYMTFSGFVGAVLSWNDIPAAPQLVPLLKIRREEEHIPDNVTSL